MSIAGLVCFFIAIGGLGFLFGGVYPVLMVFMNKVVFKSKLSVREILRRI